jgi:putative ABC transport system permease protein
VNSSRGRLALALAVGVAVCALGIGVAMQQSLLARVEELRQAMGADILEIGRTDGEMCDAEDLAALRRVDGVEWAAGTTSSYTASSPGKPYKLTYREVTPDYPQTLGVTFAAGGGFSAEPGPEAILGAEVAAALFGEKSPLGQAVGGLTIVGVLAAVPSWDRLRGALNGTVLVPDGRAPAYVSVDSGEYVLLARVAGDPALVRRRIAEQFPDWRMTDAGWLARITNSVALRSTRASVVASLALVVLVAVGVAASMTLSVLQRTREIGIRRAIGAGRGQIARQVIREAILVSVTGGVAGSAVAAAVSPIVGGAPDWTYLALPAYAAVVGALAAIVPAAAAARMRPVEALAQREVTASGRRRGSPARWVAATAVAMATCGAGLGVAVALAVDRELDSAWAFADERTLVVASGAMAGLVSMESQSILPPAELRRGDSRFLSALSEVEGAVYILLAGGEIQNNAGDTVSAQLAFADPGFAAFDPLNVVGGRGLTEADIAARSAVCLVGKGTAETLFGSTAEALGSDITASPGSHYRVIGVYEDGIIDEPFGKGLVAPTQPDERMVFGWGRFLIRLRPGVDTEVAKAQVSAAFAAANPRKAPVSVVSLTRDVDRTRRSVLAVAQSVAPSLFIGVAAAAWVTLSVVRFLLRTRTLELGVRRAIGMRRLLAARLGSREALGLAWLGSCVGCLTAGLIESPVRRWVLAGASAPTDLVALGTAFASSLGLVAALGAWSAWRMTHASPADMLQKGRE